MHEWVANAVSASLPHPFTPSLSKSRYKEVTRPLRRQHPQVYRFVWCFGKAISWSSQPQAWWRSNPRRLVNAVYPLKERILPQTPQDVNFHTYTACDHSYLERCFGYEVCRKLAEDLQTLRVFCHLRATWHDAFLALFMLGIRQHPESFFFISNSILTLKLPIHSFELEICSGT